VVEELKTANDSYFLTLVLLFLTDVRK